MRKARFLAPWKDEVDGKPAIYHCISRVVDRRFVLKRVEMEQFVRLLRLYEAFCGIRVLTYCVMSNHFHLLLEVPPAPREELPDEEFLSRLGILYPEGEVLQVRTLLEQCRKDGHATAASDIKARYTYRMWDLSQFMKSLKQRFSRWFNKRHRRRGTLWEERFKSVLVEDGYTARIMAGYIDLNPVRAGMESDPKDHRWCGYAAALAGDKMAVEGIMRVMGVYRETIGGQQPAANREEAMAGYRVILFEDGEEVYQADEGGGCRQVARRGMTTKEVEKVRKAGGVLGRSQLLRHRVEYFVDGAVIGRREFVEGVIASAKHWFGSRRKQHARTMEGSAVPLFSLRGGVDAIAS